MYQFLTRVSNRYFKSHKHTLFKVFFNLSPMYRRSTGRITSVTSDLSKIEIEIPLSYKNKNYVGTIFGGSLFSATDPIYMVQLIQLLGKEYVVWDKSSVVKFKRPASSNAYAMFEFTPDEVIKIKEELKEKKEIDIVKMVHLISRESGNLFCEIEKTIYVAEKAYYKEKKKKRSDNQ